MGVGIGYKSSSSSTYEPPKRRSVTSSSYEPKRSSSTYEPLYKRILNDGNPDPKNFEIKKFEVIANYIIVKIHYPNCTNYEGNKIVVYRDVTPKQVLTSDTLDPHFFDGKGIQSPIARFVPTDEGWNMAVHFCKHYTGNIY